MRQCPRPMGTKVCAPSGLIDIPPISTSSISYFVCGPSSVPALSFAVLAPVPPCSSSILRFASGKRGRSNRCPDRGVRSVLRNGKESWSNGIRRTPPNLPVPVFDGRKRFRLIKYRNHPYTGDIAKGSTVMLLFTVRKGVAWM